MIEYMQKGDPRILFLKPEDNVYFSKGWTLDRLRDQYFKVKFTKPVKRDVWTLVAKGTSVNIDLNANNGWLPTTNNVLYEMNVVLKGDVLLYPKWPSTEYLWQFQKVDFKPNPADDEKRYIGYVDEDDIPGDWSGGILKIYTVKDMNPIRLELYNDGIEDEKAIVRFKVNMCWLEKIAKPTIYRKIQHYRDFT